MLHSIAKEKPKEPAIKTYVPPMSGWFFVGSKGDRESQGSCTPGVVE
jgi:hypothetical protein